MGKISHNQHTANVVPGRYSLTTQVIVSNAELIKTNIELAEAKIKLERVTRELAKSELKFNLTLQQAPAAMCIVTSRSLVLESANEVMLAIWGKTSSILGKPLGLTVPELGEAGIFVSCNEVFDTGRSFQGNNVKVVFDHAGILKEGFFTFILQPMKDHDEITIGIIAVAFEVTDQLTNIRDRIKAEQMLRFSIEAANVGTWFLDYKTNEYTSSDRLKELFGFHPEDKVSIEDTTAQIDENYRDRVVETITASLLRGEKFNIEFPATGYHDKKVRWIRAIGNYFPDDLGNYSHFSGMSLDITEQKQDEIRKDDFIGMVSHELKTPLTTLKGYVQMLHERAKKQDDKFVSRALEKVNSQVNKMATLVNGFLNVSLLESGKISLVKKEFNLNRLIREMIGESRMIVLSHQIDLLASESVTLNADRDKIGSVISNLISNAVKYSPINSKIELSCHQDGVMAVIQVKDAGLGIKPSDLEKLFDRYFRVENQNSYKVSGFGIGLYLCAEIIQRHQGRIWAESEPGKGSVFHFSIPVSGPEEIVPEADAARNGAPLGPAFMK